MEPPQGEDMMHPPVDMKNGLRQTESVRMDHPEDIAAENENTPMNNNTNEEPRVTSNICKPVAVERPKIQLPSQRIYTQIHFMRDHALIGKFIGLWPMEKALHGWITAKWKPKGHITLQLGPKGFFTAIFNYLEDRNRVLDGGPYFFNVAGIYLRGWSLLLSSWENYL